MTLPHLLVILSSIISIAGISAYIRDTLSGKTKPNRVSWAMWALAPLIATGAALSAGADVWATVRVFLGGFLPLVVFLVSFINPKSYWKLTGFDYLCGAFSALALIAWLGVDSPRIAVIFAICADGFASIPTIRKVWLNPETETGSTYMASALSALLVFPSIPAWNIENSAFQIFLFLINAVIFLAIYRKRLGFGARHA